MNQWVHTLACCVALFGTAAANAQLDSLNIPLDCPCTDEIAPVCVELADGTILPVPNACIAECLGLPLAADQTCIDGVDWTFPGDTLDGPDLPGDVDGDDNAEADDEDGDLEDDDLEVDGDFDPDSTGGAPDTWGGTNFTQDGVAVRYLDAAGRWYRSEGACTGPGGQPSDALFEVLSAADFLTSDQGHATRRCAVVLQVALFPEDGAGNPLLLTVDEGFVAFPLH